MTNEVSSKKPGAGRVFLLVLIVGILLGSSFLWGFFTHQKGIFPFQLMRQLSRQVGLKDKKPSRVQAQVPEGKDREDLLIALPYTGGTYDPERKNSGVMVFKPEKTFQGMNFYNSTSKDRAVLVSMRGNVKHEWTFPSPRWDFTKLLSNGDVLGVQNTQQLVRLDKDSNVLWSYPGPFHHDVWVDNEGTIYALSETIEVFERIHPSTKTRDDLIVVLSADGQLIEEISLLEILLDSPYAYLLPSISHQDAFGSDGKAIESVTLDPLHANHVEVFDGRHAETSEIFARGNMMVCLRHLHAVFIIDRESREIVWFWGPLNLTLPHHPVLLENGNIMVFNNRSTSAHGSQILEVDPITFEIEWTYEDPSHFFTKTRGSNQRLPNGNTLITESDTGYVFEVTPDGERVWEFANPDIDPRGIRSAMVRMTRHAPEDVGFLRD